MSELLEFMSAHLESLVVLVLVGAGMIGIGFLVSREAMCWYWKINDISQLLSKIHEELTEIRKKL